MASSSLQDVLDSMHVAGSKVSCRVCYTEVFAKPDDTQMSECACGKTFAQLEKEFIKFEGKAKVDEQKAIDEKTAKVVTNQKLHLPSSHPGKHYCMPAVYNSLITVAQTASADSVKNDWDEAILGESMEDVVTMIDKHYVAIADQGAKTKFLDEFRKAGPDDILKALIATFKKHNIK